MSRTNLLLLSLLDCGFGAVALSTHGSTARVAYGLNFALAVLLAVLTSSDLRQRGWRWMAPLIGLTYVAAPFIGLVLYAVASRHSRALVDGTAE